MALSPCPSRERLLELLDERLSAVETETLTSHTDACLTCQQALEELTAGAADFRARLRRAADEQLTPLPDLPPWQQTLPEVAGYEVLGLLGRGGEGVVYRARHRALGRLVALKLVRGGGGPLQLQRFRQEAGLLAQLSHPNIVQVYDVGEHDGLPFFALEYVAGGSLGQRLTGQPLPARLAAGLVEAVARAVHAAHQAGVVHRDLKPANILLQSADGGPLGERRQAEEDAATSVLRALQGATPKVSDFGLAKVVQVGEELTATGAVLGTPEYMAPEQARGKGREAGPACDVYALGAVLYQVLTGRPPFVGEGVMDVLLQVVHAEPLAPRRLNPAVPRDLETVCLKCLEKEPGRRYASAEALADDLARYRRGEPVVARRTSLLRRGLKWARRRPTAAALVGTCVLLLGLVGGVSAAEALREAQRAERAVATERRVRTGLQTAETLGKEASRLRGSPDQWKDTLARARLVVQQAQDLANSGEVTDELHQEVRRVQADLDEAEQDRALLAELDDILLLEADSGEREVIRAREAERFAAAFRGYGIDVLVLEPAEIARRLRAHPLREDLLAAIDDWVRVAPDKAQRGRLVEVLQAVDSDPGSFRNRWRAASTAQDRAALEKLAVEAVGLGPPRVDLVKLASYLRQIQATGTAVWLLGEARWQRPNDFWLAFELGRTFQDANPPRPEEAVSSYRVALALRPRTPTVLNNLGNALAAKGERDEAMRCYLKALEFDPRYAVAHDNLGNVLAAKGHLDEAIAAHRRAIAFDPRYAKAHTNLGNVLKDKGVLDEAIEAHRQAIKVDPGFAGAYSNLGNVLQARNQLDEAIGAYRKAIAINPGYARAHTNLGVALQKKGLPDEAIQAFRKGIDLDPRDALAHRNLGNALKAKGQLDEAIKLYRQAIVLDPQHAKVHTSLGNALYVKGEVDEAIQLFRQAIILDPRDVQAHTNLGGALKDKGKVDEAIELFRQAIVLDPRYARAHGSLGKALLRQGRFAQARDATRRGLDLLPPSHPLRKPATEQLQQCERLLTLDEKWPAILAGQVTPTDAAERIALAQLCQEYKQRYATAARFYAEAFADQPKLANDLRSRHRYKAACSAARAAGGQGADARVLPDKVVALLRRQALGWLRADLAVYAKLAERPEAAAKQEVRQRLMRWQKDADLASVRDQEALDRFPDDDWQQWRTLWREVATLLAQVDQQK